MKAIIFLREGLRFFRRKRYTAHAGFSAYQGDATRICEQVVTDCYDKKHQYFRTSTGNFCQFYSRDFSWCTEALLRLGHVEKVRNTLRYALRLFEKHKKVCTSITPYHLPFDVPTRSPDSFAYLLRSLALLDDDPLLRTYKQFLTGQIETYTKRFYDPATNLIRSGNFSSMKDHAKRTSSCYDNTMLWLAGTSARALGLDGMPDPDTIRQRIIEEFWNGSFFYDDLAKEDYVAGDANVLPFWTGMITDAKIRAAALGSLKEGGLTSPFPLRYQLHKQERTFFLAKFATGYEDDSVWAHLGMLYLSVLAKHRPSEAKTVADRYSSLVAEHGTFLEVYNNEGKPFAGSLYMTDEGMLWSSILLDFLKRRSRG